MSRQQVRAAGPTSGLKGGEALAKLREYVRTRLSYDSFGIVAHCWDGSTREKPDNLFQVEEQGRKYLVRLSPLVGLPQVIKDLAVHDKLSELTSNIEDAKERLAERVILKLAETKQLREDPAEPSWKEHKEPTGKQEDLRLCGKGGSWVRAVLLRPLRERWLLKWPSEASVSLFIVEEEGATWGLVTASPAKHHYQLIVNKQELSLEVVNDGFEWQPSELDSVHKFHRGIAGGTELPELLIVKVQDRKIDYEAMKETPGDDAPSWLPALFRRMDRLTFWELVREWGPAEPPPSPLKLEKIFDAPEQVQKQEFGADVECMAKVGKQTLRLAAAMAESARDPHQSRESLERKVEEYLNPARLRDLIVKTGLIELGTRQDIRTTDEVCEMIFALMGAHKLESDVFSVLRLWEWFIDLANKELDKKAKYKGLEETASDYVAACPRYLGRTPSYIEFGEMDPSEKDKDVPGPYLRVRYEESDDGHYRWNNGIAEEKRPEISDMWRRLPFDPLSGTFCSPSMKLLQNGEKEKDRPLPNKLCAWLRGRRAQKVVSIKHSIELTPPYFFLREEEQEEEDEEGTVKVTTYLFVYYKQLQGEVYYRRSPRGGLGEEFFQGKRHHLSYSEGKKTLVSQVIPGWPLPRKVVTWLLDGRCLADLIQGRRKSAVSDGTCEVKSEEGRTQAIYHQRGERVVVQATPIKSQALGGFIYQFSTEGSSNWQALSYSEERKEWVRNISGSSKLEEEGVPCEAISAIAPPDEVSAGSGASSLKTPTSVKLLFPNASGTALAEIEQQTDHRFKRPQFLAEALTHYSAQSKAVRSNGHLAFVGEVVLEFYVTDKVVREAIFFGSHLLTNYKEGTLLGKSFSAPAGFSPWPPRPPAITEENRPGVDNVISLERRIWVCCNHVSYAASSVQTELHENMNKNSDELQDAINRFVKKVAPREKDKQIKWPQVFKMGAPKALGDVFLAVVGAIVMDADYLEAEGIITKHFQDSEQIFKIMREKDVPAGIPHHDILCENGLRKLREDDPKGWMERFHQALQDSPQQLPLSNLLYQGGLDMDAVCRLNDICMVRVQDGSSSKEVIGSTPRNLLIHIGLERDPGSSDGSELSHKSESVAEDFPQNDVDKNKPTEQDGAIYCKHCQMWLNGPTQWADHEIGKKHRKAVRRQQADRFSGKPLYDEEIPALPSSFGKKTLRKEDERTVAEVRAGIKADRDDMDGSAADYESQSGDYNGGRGRWQAVDQQYYAPPWVPNLQPASQMGRYLDDQTGEWKDAYIVTSSSSGLNLPLQ